MRTTRSSVPDEAEELKANRAQIDDTLLTIH